MLDGIWWGWHLVLEGAPKMPGASPAASLCVGSDLTVSVVLAQGGAYCILGQFGLCLTRKCA